MAWDLPLAYHERMTRKKKTARAVPDKELVRFAPLLDAEPEAAGEALVVKSKVWRWKPDAAWHFARVPKTLGVQIRARSTSSKRGWGSVPVKITVGDTEWETSLFPEGKSGTFIFAIKASVRKAEGIEEGSNITAQIVVRK